MWNELLKEFFLKYEYPQAGAEALLESLDAICAHPGMFALMAQGVAAYESWQSPEKEDIQTLLNQVRQGAETHGFPKESTELLLFLLLCPHLEALYRQKGLPDDWFAGVARDLRSKLNECHAVRGIWGSFVADWFVRFFAVDRFVPGRLQFELIAIPAQYCPEGFAHMAGQPAVNVHIPSGAPLRPEDVRSSMAAAAQFYADRFPDGNVLFICHSWLLFPGHLEMLPESSGIRQFMAEFTLAGAYDDPTGHDLWRIFNADNTADLDALPQETSLQRAYVKWLKAGRSPGGGIGIRYLQA